MEDYTEYVNTMQSVEEFEKEFGRLLTETIENLKKLAEEFRKMSEMMGGNV